MNYKIQHILIAATVLIVGFSFFVFGGILKASACDTNCNYPPLTVSCAVSASTVELNKNVQFSATVSGGNGYYTYSWTGTDDLQSYYPKFNVSYDTTGTKTATVLVTSDGKTVSRTCSVVVTNTPPPVSNLVVSCLASPSQVNIGDNVNYTSTVSGGNGLYTYSWSGTDGLSSFNRSVSKSYTTEGTKSATVTVHSGNLSKTATCNTTVIKSNNCNNDCYPPLVASCAVSASNVNLNENVQFSSSVSGGNGYYTYSWTGTDDLQSYYPKFNVSYDTVGTKTATVVITSNGKSVTKTCSVVVKKPSTPPTCDNNCYPALIGSCSVSASTANIGEEVVFNTSVSGGNGYYTYSWTGTDDLQSYYPHISKSYDTSGYKNATVVITSNGKSVTKTCSVNIKQPTTPNLVVACTANPSSVELNDQVTWTSTVSGGNGNYSYSWSGTNSLNGSSDTVYKSYNTSGTKTGTVRVTSGSQTKTATCTVNVNSTTQNNLGGYCEASPSDASVYDQVTWRVSANGGNGNYTYSWSGTDGLYGSSDTIYRTYSTSGTKNGTVTIYSNGQSITRSCSTSIRGNNNSNLSAYCVGNPSNARINDNVTWTVYPSGENNSNNNYNNNNSYSYSWSGTDNLYGSNQTINKSYSQAGNKNANVTVYSNGQRVTANCNINVQNNQTNTYLYTEPTNNGGVYLNSIPATGISPTVKTTLFVTGLFGWSAFMGYLYLARRNEKARHKALLDSVK